MKSIWNKDFFKKNAGLFKKRFPSLFDIFSDLILEIENKEDVESFFDFWKLSLSPKGFPCGEENGLKLHSAYNPQREAEGQLSALDKNTQALVFEGFGLGYSLLAAAVKAELAELPFIILEPCPLHFFASLFVFDWEAVFAHKNLIIALTNSSEEAVKLINQYSVTKSLFISMPAWKSHNSAFFAQVDELVARNREKEKINGATTKKFGYLWNRNCWRNARVAALLDDAGIYRHKALAADSENSGGLSFLLVAAGPSLGKILPYLREISKRCIIVAVDTALRLLIKNGCQPDFVVLTDPQYYAWCHIAGIKAPESVLVTLAEAYPAVFREKFRKIVTAKSQMPLGRFIEDKMAEYARIIFFDKACGKGSLAEEAGKSDFAVAADESGLTGAAKKPGLSKTEKKYVFDRAEEKLNSHLAGQGEENSVFSKTDLGSGGSVASCAWNFCHLCGARKIYLAGLDLAFPERQTHIKGSTFEQKTHSSSSRLMTGESKALPSYFGGNLTEGKNYLGQKVKTDSRMKMFAWWFESRFAQCPEVKNYTLSPEGLCIPGVQLSSVEELLQEPDISLEKKIFFEKSEGRGKSDSLNQKRNESGFEKGMNSGGLERGIRSLSAFEDALAFDNFSEGKLKELKEKAFDKAFEEMEKRLTGISLKDFDKVKKALES